MEISVLLYIQYDINAALNPPKHKSTGRCNNLSHLNISLSRSGITRIGDFSIRSPPLGELRAWICGSVSWRSSAAQTNSSRGGGQRWAGPVTRWGLSSV